MSIPRIDRHPDHVRSGKRVQGSLPDLEEKGGQESGHEEQHDNSQRLLYVMRHITTWDHGYLKVRRSTDTDDLHLTWTWTITAAAGSYVYVKVSFWDIELGLDMLCRKVFEVDEGVRKPTPDKRKLR